MRLTARCFDKLNMTNWVGTHTRAASLFGAYLYVQLVYSERIYIINNLLV